MKALKTSAILLIAIVAFVFLFSCATSSTTIVNSGITDPKDDCPYQRLRFVGSSTVSVQRGIMLLDSLSAAISLEQRGLTAGHVNKKLRLQVASLTKEVGNFAVPISSVEASEYVKLSNSICTVREDLYKGLFRDDPALKDEAGKLYLELLGAINSLKKKATVQLRIEEVDTVNQILFFNINNSNQQLIEIAITSISLMHRDSFPYGGEENDPVGIDLLEVNSRIDLKYLEPNVNINTEQKPNNKYSFFDRKSGVITIPANKAEYFSLNYSTVSDKIFDKILEQYDELAVGHYLGREDGGRNKDFLLPRLLFFINIEYNDPTGSTGGSLNSELVKLFR